MADVTRPATAAGSALGDGETPEQREARLAYEAKRIAASDASFAAGRVVPMSAVRAWIDSIDTPDELPPPRAK